MTVEEIMVLSITNIQEKEKPNKDIKILFAVQNHSFDLLIRELDGLYIPMGICHAKQTQYCSFCDGNSNKIWHCNALSPHLNTLFLRLIESNQLRLNWLYREYEWKLPK